MQFDISNASNSVHFIQFSMWKWTNKLPEFENFFEDVFFNTCFSLIMIKVFAFDKSHSQFFNYTKWIINRLSSRECHWYICECWNEMVDDNNSTMCQFIPVFFKQPLHFCKIKFTWCSVKLLVNGILRQQSYKIVLLATKWEIMNNEHW